MTGLQTDSRRVAQGDLFVAVRGGVEYVEDALARGAAAALVPGDAHAALAALAGRVRERSGARFVAITGSMGKTSTKDILGAICSPQRRTVAAERSYNAEIGVPLTIGRVGPDTELCILELAMRGFGQIAELCSFARPHVGVITNIGPVHLEKVGDLEGVARAKGELVAALPPGGTAVVPSDFAVGRADLEIVRIGEDVRLVSFEPPTLVTSLGVVEVGFTARHLAENALTALATAHALGLEAPSDCASSSRSGGIRSCRFRVAACSSTTRGTRTRCPCARRSPIWSHSPTGAERSPCWARWLSSVPTPRRATLRWGAPSASSESTR